MKNKLLKLLLVFVFLSATLLIGCKKSQEQPTTKPKVYIEDIKEKRQFKDVELYYEVTGVQSDEAVVFLNGVGMSVPHWAPMVKVFRENYKCVLHDMRGQFLSEKPDMEYTMEMNVEDLKNILDYLNIKKVHLIGTSYGSEVGMIFAYTYPERVKTLSVICGVSQLDGVLSSAVESWRASAEASPTLFSKVMRPWNYSSKYIEANLEKLNKSEENMENIPKEFFKGFLRLVDSFKKLNITQNLKNIKCPTLIIAGEFDIIKPPRFGKIIHENISGSEFMILKDSGHAAVFEKPEELNKLITDFIKKQ